MNRFPEKKKKIFSPEMLLVCQKQCVFQIKLCLCTFKSLPDDDYTVFPSTEFTYEVLINNVGTYNVLRYKPCRRGIVVIASACRTEDPGFESRQGVRFF
jgi:hypothetical protein